MVRVMRAANMIGIVKFFDAIGTPIERELARAKLPTLIEEIPESFVSSAFVLTFRQNCQKIEKIDDLGWRIYHRRRVEDLNPQFLRAADGTVTVYERIKALAASLRRENNHIDCSFHPSDEGVFLRFNDAMPRNVVDTSPIEWGRLIAFIAIVQNAIGADWCPSEIHFMSRFRPCDDALASYSGTRFLFGQPHTAFCLPHEVLARRGTPLALTPEKTKRTASAGAPTSADNGLVRSLRTTLQPYLREGSPSVALAAQIAGVSPRSLQRKLGRHGLTYSRLLDQCRFEMACELVADPDLKLIDVALSLGFDDPSNFGRTFRRVSGLSPSAYRAAVLEGRLTQPAGRVQVAHNTDGIAADPHRRSQESVGASIQAA